MRRFAFASALVPLALVACVTSDPILGTTGAGGNGDDGGPSGAGGVIDGPAGAGGDVFEGDPVCGDDVCDTSESDVTCPGDCAAEGCGDDVCDATESCATCVADCGVCPECGDDVCDAAESCEICPEDCGACACEPDALEPNGGSGTAQPIADGVDYCDLSVCAGDFDWFEFDANAGYTVTVEFLHAEGDLDLEIYSGTTGNYVTGSYSANDDEAVTQTTSGPFYARVYGADGAENWDYCIRVDL